jgi:hypothetical protein
MECTLFYQGVANNIQEVRNKWHAQLRSIKVHESFGISRKHIL